MAIAHCTWWGQPTCPHIELYVPWETKSALTVGKGAFQKGREKQTLRLTAAGSRERKGENSRNTGGL